MLEIEDWRTDHVARGAKVDDIFLLDIPLLAEDDDAVTLAADGEVAGGGDGVEEGEVVADDVVATRSVNFAHHGDGEVHELDGDHGVARHLAGNQLVLDVGGGLLPTHATEVQGAEHGEVNVAVGIQRIARDALAITLSCFGRGADARGRIGEIEECGNLGIAGVDHDGDLVLRAEPDLGLGEHCGGFAGGQVLEIGDLLGRAAGSQQQGCGEER